MFKVSYYPGAVFALLCFFLSCSPLISPYDHYSYIQTTSLKVEALHLMDMATEDASQHEAEIKAVSMSIEKIQEYQLHRPKNTLTSDQWKILSNPDGNLFGGFLREWRKKKVLGRFFIAAKQEQVGKAFDEIIKLEAKKIK